MDRDGQWRTFAQTYLPGECICRAGEVLRTGEKKAARTEEGNSGMFTITGTVGTDGKYLVTGMPVDTTTHTVLKLAFENNTAGTNLSLCAGSDADFSAGTAGITLSDSGGPGFKFLTIIDTHALSGKIIYVLREVGSADSQFTLTVD